MSFRIIPAGPEHVAAVGDIVFRAFEAFQRRHGFEPDFHSPEFAGGVARMLIGSGRFCGLVAVGEGGRVLGSNFAALMDPVAGIGPITVDPAAQARGIGRALMAGILERVRAAGYGQIRLLQDGHNTTSISLYASLGFEWRESVAFMQLVGQAGADVSGVRPATMADLPAIGELSARLYGTPRGNELRFWMEGGFGLLVRERGGRAVGYFAPGLVGHGAAGELEDVLALAEFAARHAPPEARQLFCPMSNGALFAALLGRGCRVKKMMNLMAMGAWARPGNPWLPSVYY